MSAIDGAAEPFKGVVSAIGDLYIFDCGAAAHAAHGEAVDFLVGLEGYAREFDAYIFQNA